LRVPGWLRMLTLPAWLGLLGWSWWTWVRPALRFNPDETEVALRVERSYPDLKGKLGSASDLAHGRAAFPSATSRGMADAGIRQTVNLWADRDAAGLVRTHALKRAALALAGAAAVTAGLFALSPSGFWIGAQRVVTPWSGAEWPKRTGVADATDAEVHALGAALPLRALLTRSQDAPDQTDVFVEYRFLGKGAPSGGWRKELLTWQGREGETTATALDPLGREQTRAVTGALFERLIDPAGESVEYRLLTRDDETPTRTIKLVPPPVLVSAQASVTPPAYTSAAQLNIDLGPGTDERASAPPALAGSRIDLKLNLSTTARFDPPLQDQIRLIDGPETPVALTGSGSTWTLSWTLGKPVRLVVRPVDQYGIAATDDAVVRFDALEDKPAEATITTPGTDRGVLPTALIEVVAEARDDVGLRSLALERTIAKPAGREGGEKSGSGGALEPVGDPESIASETPANSDAQPPRALTVRSGVDLAVLGVKPGDEVRLTALAADVFAAPVGPGDEAKPREATRSAVRTLRIISESQFIEEVQRELTQVRQSAIRIEAQQGEVQSRTTERGADRQSRRGQAQVTERIGRQAEAVQRVADRVKENGLMDPALAEVLQRAGQTIEQAGQSSSEAGKTLDEASSGLPEPPPEAADAKPAEPLGGAKATAAAGDQQQVRDEMTKLAEMLDKGQDSWVVRNKLEQLIKAQEALREQTGQTGDKTAGKSASELTPQERSDLEQIVDRQTQLAEEVQKLAREMREKAEQVAKKDSAAAQGMKDAADRAEQQQVSEGMKSAAQSAGQNRMSDAGRRQEQAAKALKQMKEDLDANEKRRTMMLMRKLQEITEALERLVKEQEKQLTALDAAQQGQSGYAGLDKGMIALNQNTIAVEEQATSTTGLESVAKLIGKANQAQAGAIAALRVATVDPEPVKELENESLDALKTALDRARKLNEEAKDAEERQKLAELKQKYQDALKEQERVRGEAAGFAQMKELARRDRVLVRRLGEAQTAVGTSLTALHETTKELQEALVFDYAHKRLAETTTNAAKALENADANAALRPQDATITNLKNLIDALTDPKNDSKFAQGAGGGGGGGQGQKPGLLPPAKQLRLLRMMQAEIAQATHGSEQNAPEAPDANTIATQQRDIAQLGSDLLKKLSAGGGGGEEEPAIPFGPAPKPGDEPAEPENEPDEAIPLPEPAPQPGAGEQKEEQRRAA
ncbi:MAG: hypothetical protein ACKVZJ_12005, partial [Phycisphaerales bacterium]